MTTERDPPGGVGGLHHEKKLPAWPPVGFGNAGRRVCQVQNE
jgi:hypothetical protein